MDLLTGTRARLSARRSLTRARPTVLSVDSELPDNYAAVTMATKISSIFLVAVAVFVVMAHVCVGPFHAHAGAVTTHSEDHPEHGSDEAAHGGSCEALRTTASVDLPALPAARLDVVVSSALLAREVVTQPKPPADTSPPLFLLHASLLI
jgi:hypothetical protein